MIHWLLLYCHQQVDSDICASDWKFSDKTGSINIQKMLKHRETQTYTGTLNAQSKHLPYVWSYRSISMTFVLQICGADWGLMVDYTWYQNCFLCRCLLMWKYSGSGFFFPWSSWLIHEPHHILFDLTQLCLWNLFFQTSCIKPELLEVLEDPQNCLMEVWDFHCKPMRLLKLCCKCMRQKKNKKGKKNSPQQKQILHSWT